MPVPVASSTDTTSAPRRWRGHVISSYQGALVADSAQTAQWNFGPCPQCWQDMAIGSRVCKLANDAGIWIHVGCTAALDQGAT